MTIKPKIWMAALGALMALDGSAMAASRQMLSGHIPPPVSELKLQPLERMAATNKLHIAINLPLRNDADLDSLITDIYDPTSKNFHHYLSPEEFAAKFGPTAEDYKAVMDFANANGLKVTRVHPAHAIMGIDATVADIEKTLHVHMMWYQHPTEKRRFYAPDSEPSVDLDVAIKAISGLDDYVRGEAGIQRITNAPSRPKPLAGSGPNGNLIGYDFRHAYAPDMTNTGTGQVLGMVEFNGSGFVGGGGYNSGDIQLYEKLAGLPKVAIGTVFQPNPPGEAGLDNAEFSLDLEMAISMAPGLKEILLYLPAGVVTDEEMYQEMAYPTNGIRPNQITSSWALDTSPASTNYLRELVVQGQSLLKYSGDGGAFLANTNIYPGFNYMTIVGGTDLNMNGNGVSYQSEQVWSGSSGGYVGGIPMPFYQEGTDVTAAGGTTQHRDLPDIAAAASDIIIVDSFQPSNGVRQTEQVVTNVGGTSAATPLWAAFVALVNEQGAMEGKPPVGFLNPTLYSIGNSPKYSGAFNDITVGNNTWSNSPNLYYAKKGYDLCTGWGSPNGSGTMNALLAYSGPVFVQFGSKASPADGSFDFPYPTLAAGTNAVASGGTIFIIRGGSSTEKMTIKKPLTITAIDGAATVGN